MLFFQFPEDARWNASAEAIEFSVILGPYEGTVRVPKRSFQGVLDQSPTPQRCLEAFHLQRTRFEMVVERKLRRRQLADDGNVEVSGRDLRENAASGSGQLVRADGYEPMTTSADLRRLALALEGTTEAPHFDRTAFKVKRIYVTLAPDGETANFMFTPEQQEFRCMMAPDAFAPVPNAWGQRGATTVTLSRLSLAELEDALRTAWNRATPRKSR